MNVNVTVDKLFSYMREAQILKYIDKIIIERKRVS